MKPSNSNGTELDLDLLSGFTFAWRALAEVLIQENVTFRRKIEEKLDDLIGELEEYASPKSLIVLRSCRASLATSGPEPSSPPKQNKPGEMTKTRPSREATGSRKIGIKIGSRLKLKLGKERPTIPLSDPIPGFLFGISAEGEESDFLYGYYDKHELLATEPFQIFEADGVEFLIPQEHVRKRLRNKTIEIIDGKLTIVE